MKALDFVVSEVIFKVFISENLFSLFDLVWQWTGTISTIMEEGYYTVISCLFV